MTDSPPSDRRAAEAWRTHHEQTQEALTRGDSASIKKLYTDFGSLLSDAYTAEDVPMLSLPETLMTVTRLLADVKGVVLDAGCGPNPAVAIAIARRSGVRVAVLDIGPDMVRLARDRGRADGVELLAVVGDVEALPFRTNVFDATVCDDTIEHLPDDRAGIRELARTAKQTGRIVIATPNRRRAPVVLRKVADRLRRKPRPASDYFLVPSHLREYTWSELEDLLDGPLRVTRRVPIGWSGGVVRSVAGFLTMHWPLRHFSRMVAVEAQRRENSPA